MHWKTEEQLTEHLVRSIVDVWSAATSWKTEVSCHDRARVDLCILTPNIAYRG